MSGGTIECSFMVISDPTNHQFSVMNSPIVTNTSVEKTWGLPVARTCVFEDYLVVGVDEHCISFSSDAIHEEPYVAMGARVV